MKPLPFTPSKYPSLDAKTEGHPTISRFFSTLLNSKPLQRYPSSGSQAASDGRYENQWQPEEWVPLSFSFPSCGVIKSIFPAIQHADAVSALTGKELRRCHSLLWWEKLTNGESEDFPVLILELQPQGTLPLNPTLNLEGLSQPEKSLEQKLGIPNWQKDLNQPSGPSLPSLPTLLPGERPFHSPQCSRTHSPIYLYVFLLIPGTQDWHEIYYSKFKALHNFIATLKTFPRDFFFLTWKFNQTTPWSWICLASWWGVVFTPAVTCTPDSIQLQISVISTHLQMALNGQLCLLSIITVTYPVLQISEQLLKLLYSKMVQNYMKTEILLRSVNRERLVSSLIFICFLINL